MSARHSPADADPPAGLAKTGALARLSRQYERARHWRIASRN